jgi:superfamily II DNA or RNA helicase
MAASNALVDKCLARSLKPMQPHQKKFIKAFMRSTRRGSIAIHSPGSGKTLMAMGASKCYLAEYPDSRVIFVAPASLIGAHETQLREYEQKLPGGRVPQMAKFSFYTYAGFSNAVRAGELKMCEGALVICDEAQALKGAETQIFSDISACAGLSTKVILLSATPITNTDADLMNLMTVANGSVALDHHTMDAILNNDTLMRAFFGCQLSWYTSDPKKMAAYFPRKETRIVPIVMDAATMKTYTTLEGGETSRAIEGIFSLSGETVDTDLQSFFNGLRRISSSSAQKIDFMIDFIKHVNANHTSAPLGITRAVLDSHTNKFVIFTHFKDHGSTKIIAALNKAKIAYGIIDGSVSKQARTKIEADYVAGRITVILISAAGSTGLNLFETGYIFLMEPSWNNSEVYQVEARGVRYLGHAKLPKKKQNVLIMKLMLIKPREKRDFEKIVADRRGYQYDKSGSSGCSASTCDTMPSIDIKMFVDSNRKQDAIDARLAMLERRVPSIETCGESKTKSSLNISSFDEMRIYYRTSSKLASVPAGVRASGSYYAPGRKTPEPDETRISFNDSLLREIISGAGVMRISTDTAVLIAGSTDLMTDAIISANPKAFPHIMDTSGTLSKRYRCGILNLGLNFATGSPVIYAPRLRRSVLKQMNEYCDLLLVVAREGDRIVIKDELVGRSFMEASYKSEFDRIVNGASSGIVVLAC